MQQQIGTGYTTTTVNVGFGQQYTYHPGLFSQLGRVDANGNSSAYSFDKERMYNYFYYLSKYTRLEWSLIGYNDGQLMLGTSWAAGFVETPYDLSGGRSNLHMIFDIHSHPAGPVEDNRYSFARGASGYDYYRNSIGHLSTNPNMGDYFYAHGIYTEFVKHHKLGWDESMDSNNPIFPRFYVYDAWNSNLYRYDQTTPDHIMGIINSANDLMKIIQK